VEVIFGEQKQIQLFILIYQLMGGVMVVEDI